MFELHKILVPADFSVYSENALRYGCEFAERFQAELHLLYVPAEFSYILPDPEMPIFGTGDDLPHHEEIATGKLAKLPPDPWHEKLNVIRHSL